MGMFNNINTNLTIYKQVTTIPEATVQAMDSIAPYSLITSNNNFYAIPIVCYIYTLNSTTPYSGFVHLHLTYTGNIGVGYINSVLSENAIVGGITQSQIYSFLVNCQQAGFFGGNVTYKNLEIFFDTIPTAGDGDMVVTLFYTKNNRF